MAKPDCLFCKIVDGSIPSKPLKADPDAIAFADISPQAPVHFLVVPRRHVPTANDLLPGDDVLVGKLVRMARDLAKEKGVAEKGYRIVLNCNAEGGQSVFHLHLHLLGGRKMTWPPG